MPLLRDILERQDAAFRGVGEEEGLLGQGLGALGVAPKAAYETLEAAVAPVESRPERTPLPPLTADDDRKTLAFVYGPEGDYWDESPSTMLDPATPGGRERFSALIDLINRDESFAPRRREISKSFPENEGGQEAYETALIQEYKESRRPEAALSSTEFGKQLAIQGAWTAATGGLGLLASAARGAIPARAALRAAAYESGPATLASGLKHAGAAGVDLALRHPRTAAPLIGAAGGYAVGGGEGAREGFLGGAALGLGSAAAKMGAGARGLEGAGSAALLGGGLGGLAGAKAGYEDDGFSGAVEGGLLGVAGGAVAGGGMGLLGRAPGIGYALGQGVDDATAAALRYGSAPRSLGRAVAGPSLPPAGAMSPGLARAALESGRIAPTFLNTGRAYGTQIAGTSPLVARTALGASVGAQGSEDPLQGGLLGAVTAAGLGPLLGNRLRLPAGPTGGRALNTRPGTVGALLGYGGAEALGRGYDEEAFEELSFGPISIPAALAAAGGAALGGRASRAASGAFGKAVEQGGFLGRTLGRLAPEAALRKVLGEDYTRPIDATDAEYYALKHGAEERIAAALGPLSGDLDFLQHRLKPTMQAIGRNGSVLDPMLALAPKAEQDAAFKVREVLDELFNEGVRLGYVKPDQYRPGYFPDQVDIDALFDELPKALRHRRKVLRPLSVVWDDVLKDTDIGAVSIPGQAGKTYKDAKAYAMHDLDGFLRDYEAGIFPKMAKNVTPEHVEQLKALAPIVTKYKSTPQTILNMVAPGGERIKGNIFKSSWQPSEMPHEVVNPFFKEKVGTALPLIDNPIEVLQRYVERSARQLAYDKLVSPRVTKMQVPVPSTGIPPLAPSQPPASSPPQVSGPSPSLTALQERYHKLQQDMILTLRNMHHSGSDRLLAKTNKELNEVAKQLGLLGKGKGRAARSGPVATVPAPNPAPAVTAPAPQLPTPPQWTTVDVVHQRLLDDFAQGLRYKPGSREIASELVKTRLGVPSNLSIAAEDVLYSRLAPGPARKIARFLGEANMVGALGWNVAGATRGLFQGMLGATAMGGQRYAQSMRDVAADPQYWEDLAQKYGTFRGTPATEIWQNAKLLVAGSPWQRRWADISDSALALHNWADKKVRTWNFAGFYRNAMEDFDAIRLKGADHEIFTAFPEEARKRLAQLSKTLPREQFAGQLGAAGSDLTNWIYGKTGSPLISRGAVGRLLPFQTWPANYVNLMSEWLGNDKMAQRVLTMSLAAAFLDRAASENLGVTRFTGLSQAGKNKGGTGITAFFPGDPAFSSAPVLGAPAPQMLMGGVEALSGALGGEGSVKGGLYQAFENSPLGLGMLPLRQTGRAMTGDEDEAMRRLLRYTPTR